MNAPTAHGGPPRNTPERGTSRSGETPTPTPATRLGRPGQTRSRPGLIDLTTRLQPRDLVIAHLLADHKVLTTAQLTQVLFTSTSAASNRLYQLRRLGVTDRFLPTPTVVATLRCPAAHTCWVLGLLGARYVALAHEQRPPTAHAVRERQDTIAASAHLAHTLGVNQFGVDLLAHTRTHPEARVDRWWPSTRIAAALGRRVRPDAHGSWRENDRQTAWMLEYDTGTETLTHLAAKIAGYRRLRGDGGPAWPVLFFLPGRARENNLHHHLATTTPTLISPPGTATPSPATDAGVDVVVATTTRDRCRETEPAGPIWRLVGPDETPRRLIDLPSVPGCPGPYHPCPPAPGENPLHLLHASG
ncbi:MAG: hypothetical protein GXX79_11385 [Actinomycetales bacterium]|nr:hypothetical protein [Actinomycetales bacterium]